MPGSRPGHWFGRPRLSGKFATPAELERQREGGGRAPPRAGTLGRLRGRRRPGPGGPCRRPGKAQGRIGADRGPDGPAGHSTLTGFSPSESSGRPPLVPALSTANLGTPHVVGGHQRTLAAVRRGRPRRIAPPSPPRRRGFPAKSWEDRLMAVSPKDIEAVTGEKTAEREAPRPDRRCRYKLADLNGRMAELVEADQRRGGGVERVMRENGGTLYAHERACEPECLAPGGRRRRCLRGDLRPWPTSTRSRRPSRV